MNKKEKFNLMEKNLWCSIGILSDEDFNKVKSWICVIRSKVGDMYYYEEF